MDFVTDQEAPGMYQVEVLFQVLRGFQELLVYHPEGFTEPGAPGMYQVLFQAAVWVFWVAALEYTQVLEEDFLPLQGLEEGQRDLEAQAACLFLEQEDLALTELSRQVPRTRW